jgi:pyruvate/2-oxoglutarate/acetoin dehydrogenase E1 component
MNLSVIADESSPFPTVSLRHDRSADPDGLMWCYGGMVPHCLDAVQQLRDAEGLYVDLAIVSQLSPTPSTHVHRVLDTAKTLLFLYAEEASVEYGWSAEMLAQVQQYVGTTPDRPATHARIGAAHSPIPSGRELERAILPDADDIVARVLELF